MDLQLKYIADQCLLRGLLGMELGLWGGKTGMAIFFFQLFRYTGNHWYEDFAVELLDNVCNDLSSCSPIVFADGLCGIGWSIELLKSKGFVESNTDEVLEEVDKRIMEWDVSRITDVSLENGLMGIVAYVRSRLDSERVTNYQPFGTRYLEVLEYTCRKFGIDLYSDACSLQSVWHDVLQAFELQKCRDKCWWRQGILAMECRTMSVYISDEDTTERDLYEYNLYNSSLKCLFLFLEESIAIQYGIGTYVKSLLQCFTLSEWNINVISLHKDKKDVTFFVKDKIGYYNFPIPQEQLLSGNPYYEELYFKSVFFYLASRVNERKNVYCHFNFTRHRILAEAFKKYMRAFIVFTFHYADWKFDLLGDQKKLEQIIIAPNNVKETRIKQKFEKEKVFLQNTCDCVIAIAKHSYRTLHDLYGIPYSHLYYIPNGVRDSYKELNISEIAALKKRYLPSERGKILLFVGRMDVMKGAMYLMEAVRELCEEGHRLQLIVAGMGDFSQCLKILNPYWGNVIFAGFILADQLQDLYSIADFGIVPSIHEEFGYVAAEMMLNMLPVVVHDTSGLHEVTNAGKYGIPFTYTIGKEVMSLKNAIIRMMQSGVDRHSLVKGREWILKNYSEELFKKRMMGLYSK